MKNLMVERYSMPELTANEAQEITEMCEASLTINPPQSIHAKHAMVTLAALASEPVGYIHPAPVLKDNKKLAREITHRLVDVGEADPEVVATSEAWVLNKLNGAKS